MRKTGKASNNIIKIVYILLAIIWVAVSLLFFLVGSNLGSVGKVLYFLPTVVMLIVIVVGIIHLSKDNYKTRDAVVLAVLPWIFIVVDFAVSVSQDASRASIEVFMGSFFQGVITGIVGILIFIVKYTKQDIQENEKLSKILDNMMKAVYAIAAVIWVILSIFLFTRLLVALHGAGGDVRGLHADVDLLKEVLVHEIAVALVVRPVESVPFLLLYGSAWFCNIFVSAFYIFGNIYKGK